MRFESMNKVISKDKFSSKYFQSIPEEFPLAKATRIKEG